MLLHPEVFCAPKSQVMPRLSQKMSVNSFRTQAELPIPILERFKQREKSFAIGPHELTEIESNSQLL